MSYSGSFRSRRVLILDTGPIRELVTYRADLFGLRSLGLELRYLDSQNAYQNTSTFLSQFQKKLTSASVVAELNCWIRDTPKQGRRTLWQMVSEEFERMGMEENMIEFQKMELDLVTKYGPVDVSLLEIARQNVAQNPTVLTIDSKLQGACGEGGVSAMSLLEVCLQGT